jgi:hypothetical protein
MPELVVLGIGSACIWEDHIPLYRQIDAGVGGIRAWEGHIPIPGAGVVVG